MTGGTAAQDETVVLCLPLLEAPKATQKSVHKRVCTKECANALVANALVVQVRLHTLLLITLEALTHGASLHGGKTRAGACIAAYMLRHQPEFQHFTF